MASYDEKRKRNLDILRLDRASYSARAIGEAVGLSTRHVQRLLAQLRAEHEEKVSLLARKPEPRSQGRQRGLEVLEQIKEGVGHMADIMAVCEPRAGKTMAFALRESLFAEHYLELEAILQLVPEPSPNTESRLLAKRML